MDFVKLFDAIKKNGVLGLGVIILGFICWKQDTRISLIEARLFDCLGEKQQRITRAQYPINNNQKKAKIYFAVLTKKEDDEDNRQNQG